MIIVQARSDKSRWRYMGTAGTKELAKQMVDDIIKNDDDYPIGRKRDITIRAVEFNVLFTKKAKIGWR